MTAGLFSISTAFPTVWDRSGWTLSAGTASASSEENHFLRGLRTRAGAALTRPTENHCSRRSHHPPLTQTSKAEECCSVEHILLQLMVVNAKPVEEIRGDSWGRKGLGETPQCVSTRRLSSRPRKA